MFPLSNFLEEISSLSQSIVFLCFFALIDEEGFLISLCFSLELCIQMGISFLFFFAWETSDLIPWIYFSLLLCNHKGFDLGHTWMPSGFPYVFLFKSEFGNKNFMIWVTVSSRSCFCWLYRASLSLAAKNIINLILVLTTWWYPCVELSLVLLEEGVCYDQCVLLAKLLAFALLHFVLQGPICLLFRYLLTSYFCIPVPYNEKDIYFGC